MVKLNVTAGTNINHIRRNINTQKIQSQKPADNKTSSSTNHTTLLAQSIGQLQSELGFFQAFGQNLSKLSLEQEALLEIEDKNTFDKKLEEMMDIVDNTIYAGQSLFAKGIEYGLELHSLEGIESKDDVIALGNKLDELNKELSNLAYQKSVALVNTLGAISTQDGIKIDQEDHASQLERVRKLLG